jgi:hypothetical protein
MYKKLLIIAALAIPQVALADTATDCRFSTRIDDAKGINFKCKNSRGKAAKEVTASGNDPYRSCELDMVVTIAASCPNSHTVKAMVTCLAVLDTQGVSPGQIVPLSVQGKKPTTVKGNGSDSIKMKLNWNADKGAAGFIKPKVSKLKCSVLINDVLVN